MNETAKEPSEQWIKLNKVDEVVSKLLALNYLMARALASPRDDLDRFFPVEHELYSIHFLSQELRKEASDRMEDAFDVLFPHPYQPGDTASTSTPENITPESNSKGASPQVAHLRMNPSKTNFHPLHGAARGHCVKGGEA